jgi:hypothetical protein
MKLRETTAIAFRASGKLVPAISAATTDATADSRSVDKTTSIDRGLKRRAIDGVLRKLTFPRTILTSLSGIVISKLALSMGSMEIDLACSRDTRC